MILIKLELIKIKNRAEIIGLLENTKQIQKNTSKIFNKKICDIMFSEAINNYAEIILDLIGIPPDTSLELDKDHEDYFVRDAYYNIIFGYLFDNDNYTVTEVLDMLLTLNE